VEWVFLSPRKCHDISPDTIAKLLESKVATIKCFLAEQLNSRPRGISLQVHYRNTALVTCALEIPGGPEGVFGIWDLGRGGCSRRHFNW